MKGKSNYLMLLSLLFPLAFNGQQKDLTKAPFECDLLKAYAAPIQGLKFERCEEPKELSQLMKTAYYTVSGKDHARIERFLREKYKMPKLVPFMGYYENEQGGSGRIREQQGENGSLYVLDVKMSGTMKSGTDPKTGQYTVYSNSDLAEYTVSVSIWEL
ncbi:hypothetical protein BAX94_05135 [Elizabethkingia meningoseptica]|uniref:Uncharacterized protein n=1 Tax=Elizabethkingia meningoseptica TaxID=238 RepID=A0A1T3IBV3_ELIME|nr:hypothetical protein [Elizabethkingia meningoseptica]AQX13860.1 hypothetical protein BBD35_16425 [Elizabethkingia meningoseptica]MBG0515665.1 hypothetical protein [Elizabethkingia meningoseptica]MDE5433968.1 hypothetical protein [Elizabethkingia meningoseptica]MDE5447759.1 hypothetical protein [Elizabethkingia meningoseptica]MDE5470244.1 hypothetical protein [Elizabethkingia meningoseptica]